MKSDPDKNAIFGHGFADISDSYGWDDIRRSIESATVSDVDKVLAKARTALPLTPMDLGVLVSAAADERLEEMAQISKAATEERFGKTVSLYIPMYISNACTNKCVYCGFNHDNPLERITLSLSEIEEECKAIKELGPFDNLLLVAGEFPALTGVDYLEKVIKLCSKYFNNITVEVQPLKAREYKKLVDAGLYGVVCFQETYNREAYRRYHPHGMKSHFDWRLNGFDRMGEAGVYKIGIGALLGLEDWRAESVMMGHHLRYLQKQYWRSRFSINFPRLCPSESGFKPNMPVSDRELLRLILAFRLFDHDIDISISTRERAALRDNLISLGVTSMSAGSKTEPGGYKVHPEALEQFSTTDTRTPQQVYEAIKKRGYDPVWKDWDTSLQAAR
ncbi:MAG: 2-iminoacetate synthase ThiH [Muribaculaceae bacterium]|nr:2-iminoacetate synthase ThiH [Muribaculaceae bacterium]